MKLSEIAIRRPITTIMVFASMVLLGIVSLQRLPLLLLPDTSTPTGMVRIEYRERISPEQMERDIIEPIEGIISQIPDVSGIESRLGGWGSRITVHFHPDAPVQYRMVDLDERLNAFAQTFEDDMLETRSYVFASSFLNNRFMEVELTAPINDPYFKNIDLDELGSRLSQIDGVSEADSWGGTDHIIDVAINQDRLLEFDSSMFQVVERVRNHAIEPTVLGEIYDQGQRYFVRYDGQFDSSQEINDVIVRPDSFLQVRHLGQVVEKFDTRDRLYLTGGSPTIEFNMEKEAYSNPIDVSRKVRAGLADLNETMPPGYQFSVENDQAEGIVSLISHLSFTAMIGILLSMLVLFFFIRNVRMALIICLVIPICVIASFNALYFAGLTLNVVTLVGLAVGVGSLIDNSIVVMESIFRHHERGRPAEYAAIRGSKEVGWAILALTITGIIVFLPVLFLPPQESGWRREAISLRSFFEEGSLAIVMPIAISMLVALMLVPMASAKILAITDKTGIGKTPARNRFSWLTHNRFLTGFTAIFNMQNCRKLYLKILKGTLRHRVRFVLAIVLLCTYTWFYTMQEVDRDIVREPEDALEFEMYVYMPEGTKIDHTLTVVTKLKDSLHEKIPEAKEITARVEEDNAEIEVGLTDPDERERTSTTIQEDIRPYIENYAGAEVSFIRTRPDANSTEEVETTGRGGSIEIRGPEHKQLQQIANNFSNFILQLDGIRTAYTEAAYGDVEYQFHLDRETSALLEITPTDISNAIQLSQRDEEYSTINMNKDDERIAIIFSQYSSDDTKVQEGETGDLEDQGISKEELHQFPIESPILGSVVKLETLGHFEPKMVNDYLRRENRQRISRVYFDSMPNSNFREVEEQLRSMIDIYPLPAGYTMELDTRSREWESDMDSLWFLGGLAVILIYMSLAALFESFTLPLVIIFSIPLAIVGIVWFFIITNTPFDPMMSGLGAIFLMGMLPNSAILMVYTASYLRHHHNFSRNRAVLTAGHHRLRPILMTVLTTVLGLAPLAITPTNIEIWAEFGRDMNFNWVSFARVVIGGLISSTILTLIVVPGFYFILEDIQNGIRYVIGLVGKFAKSIGRWGQAPEPALAPNRPVVGVYNLRRYYPTSPAPVVQMNNVKNFFVLRPAVGFVPSFLTRTQNKNNGSTNGYFKALNGIYFEYNSGILGLLGPNGAGKTTLLRLLAGIDQPTRGSIEICGYDLQSDAKKARQYIAYLPQEFGLYEQMTAKNYLDYLALLKGLKKKKERVAIVEKALEQVNLANHAHTKVASFSAGMKQRLGLAQLLLTSPKIIIVDEPTVNLDPMERVHFRNLLSKLGQDRVVIFSTHLVEDVAHCCTDLILMHEGQIKHYGSLRSLKENADGKVFETVIQSESEWTELRRKYSVVSQSHTSEGIRVRFITENPPAYAETIEPSLEDAYLYTINPEKHNQRN